MRILHTADWHLGKNLEGKSRLEEQELWLHDFVKIVEEQRIDLVVIAGDVFDSGNPSPRAERLFYDTLKRISNDGERLTLVIAGNHDNPDRLVAANALAREHGILLVGTSKTVLELGSYGQHQVVDAGEGYLELDINGERAVILCVPFLSERRLNEVLYQAMEDQQERVASYGDRVASLFASLEKKFRPDTINLVTSHLFAMGSEESGSERSVQLGGSYIIHSQCFPTQAQYIALGHIHKPQVVPGSQGRARYAGSPLAYHRKEANTVKKCFVVELAAGKEAIIEEIIMKVYKPIEIWRCNSISEAIHRCEVNKSRSCYVYLEIVCDRFIREDEIKEMKSYKEDIVEVIPMMNESQQQESYQRNQEISFSEMFQAFYLKERGIEPSEELTHLLHQILEEGEQNETNQINLERVA